MSAFTDLGMMDELAMAVANMDWTLPTDIQSDAIPAILGGGDVLMAAETGSGKTGAFCLPILQIVHESMSQQLRPKTATSISSKAASSDANTWKLSVYDKDNSLNVDASGLLCESQHPRLWSGGRATKGLRGGSGGGKFYYEAQIESDGLCRMGWATADAALNLGTDSEGFGFGGTGKKSNGGSFDDYGESFTNQDVIGCFVNTVDGEVHFAKNGRHFPTAYHIPRHLLSKQAIYPAVVIKNARLRLNFGGSGCPPMQFPPPSNSGYVPVGEASPAQQQDTSASSQADDGGGSSSRSKPRPNNAPLCLILEPTKELAQQTFDEIERFRCNLKDPAIRNVLVAGGVSLDRQIDALAAGADIVTCTTGRLRDLVASGNLLLNYIRFFVLDEADSLCANQDGARCIADLHQRIPKYSRETGERLQMIVCSATLHNMEVKRLADSYMHFPQWIDLKGQDVVPESVHQVVCMVDPKEDMSWIRVRSKPGEGIVTDGVHRADTIRPGSDSPETLSEAVKVLKAEYVLRAIKAHQMKQAIIFCRTRLDCDHLESFLRERHNYTCLCLHGNRDPNERQRNLERFKKGEISFLICTDVAARGLDVRGVPYVINVMLPPAEEKANYVHRIGRVGRAERMGLAISIVSTVGEKVWYHKCSSRGANCNNTQLTNKGGCCIWYNETNCLSEIEEHLGVTISRVGSDFIVPQFEYEGKVVYGAKRANEGGPNYSHAVELKETVQELNELERQVQLAYLRGITSA